MKNYKMILQYDGTRYKGWQVLKNTDMTIQGKLENVLSQLAGEPVEVIGSGRTDAGVHAKGQVANFHIRDGFSKEEIWADLNCHLPEDIAVIDLCEVPERFHSRYQAVEKTYRYVIHTSEIPNVFERKYRYTYTEPLNVELMKKAAEQLCGEHDFASFCGNKKMKKSTVRIVKNIHITEEKDCIIIDYTGNGFLQNMVRIMTGTLIEVGRGERDWNSMRELLKTKDRSQAGYTVPPQGLMLMKVDYETVDGIK